MTTSLFRNITATTILALSSFTHAENFQFTNGDLILGIQASGGTGSTQNIFFNLGSGTGIRNTPSKGKVGNIKGTLDQVFGADWYSREDVWFGVVGNLNGNPTSGVGSRSPVNGDPSRTFYVSKAASTPGSGFLYGNSTFTSSALGTAGSALQGVEFMITGDTSQGNTNDPLPARPDGTAILDQTQVVEWFNSWTKWNPIAAGGQAGAFNTFTGGIQQTFGKGGNATYVDIQRILATNTGANPTGIVGGGTYVTTLAISSNGDITLTEAATSSPVISFAGAPSALSTSVGSASDASSFSVSGTDMTAGITVTAPTGFEVSTSSNASFSSNITVGTSGTIASTPVYVRIPASASSGNYTGNITLSSTGAESKNIPVSGTVTASTPVISISGNLTALSTTYGTASSTSNFTISGTNMTAPITVTPPTGFQISTSSNSSFATSINVPADGTLANTTIHVRLSPTADAGTYSGNITLTSTGATQKTIATASSTINKAAQTIDAIASVGSKAFGDAAFSVIAPSSSSSLPVTLSVKSGPASISGNSVTLTGAGTVVIAANQAGNANYNAAAEVTTNFTVSKGAQTIGAFTSIGNKTFGDAPFAIIAPTASSDLAVTLSVKSGPATISGNTVTLTGTGTVVLAANQAGSANYNAATEVRTSFTVSSPSKVDQTIAAIAAVGNKTFGDAPFVVTAPTASSNLPVSLTVISGPATISGNMVTLTSTGTVVLAANQAGDDNYNPAPEVTTSFTVSKASQTIAAFVNIENKAFGDLPFAVTAPEASSDLAVTLSVKSGPATISGNIVSITGAGTIILAANQAGNDNYAPAAEVTTSFTVAKASQTIAPFVSIGNKAFGDAPFAITAPEASSDLAVTLNVKSGPATISGNTVSITGAGTVVIAANQAGNDYYEPALEVTTNFTVNEGNSIVTLENLSNTYDGSPKSATASTTPIISGTVTFTYEGINTTIYPQSSTPPSLAGSYKVVGTINDIKYSGSATGTLIINKATPTITTPPTATSISIGQKLSDSRLSGGIASVNGTFAFTNPNTQPSTAGTSSQSVTFSPADTNNYLTTTTSIDVVTLAGSSPDITTQPIDLTIEQGSGATFSVQATGQNLSYQWKRNGVDISNARSSSYTVSSTSIATAGEYSVVVSSDNGSQPVASRAAKLIVTFPLADLTINENTSPVLIVSVTGTGLKYQWFKDGMPLRGQTNSTLTLKDITVDQAGTYSAEVTDADGNKFTSKSSKVTVNAVLPEITTQPSNVSVYTGGSATMRVMVKGAGHSYQWKKDGVAIQGEIKNTLSLNDIILSDAGDYTVSVTNSVVTVTSRSARLRVLSSGSGNQGGDTTSPVITTHPTSQTLADGGSGTLTVSATGGSLSYQWLKNGTNIAGANEATYKINPASIDKSGNYTVVVYNSSGLVTSNLAKITVNAPEIDVQQPVGSALTSGTSKISFGTARIGKAGISRTFTIKNIGNLNLNGLAITKAGAHSKEYTITRLKRRMLAPEAAITFRVTFKAKAVGQRTASIRIANNDRDENPFIINLAGQGAR